MFLGAGPLKGVARESHLKLQELSDGHVMCTYDSPLGLRHGPKAVINKETMVVMHLSNNDYTARYESDLAQDMSDRNDGGIRIGLGANPKLKDLFDDFLLFDHVDELEDEYLSVLSILPGQLVGFFKSYFMGLDVDSPAQDGSISRVVQGVKLYSYG